MSSNSDNYARSVTEFPEFQTGSLEHFNEQVVSRNTQACGWNATYERAILRPQFDVCFDEGNPFRPNKICNRCRFQTEELVKPISYVSSYSLFDACYLPSSIARFFIGLRFNI